MTPVFAFLNSPQDWLLIAVLAFFCSWCSASDMPEVGRSLGKGIMEFKKGMKGLEDDRTAPSPPPRRLPLRRRSPCRKLRAHRNGSPPRPRNSTSPRTRRPRRRSDLETMPGEPYT